MDGFIEKKEWLEKLALRNKKAVEKEHQEKETAALLRVVPGVYYLRPDLQMKAKLLFKKRRTLRPKSRKKSFYHFMNFITEMEEREEKKIFDFKKKQKHDSEITVKILNEEGFRISKLRPKKT